MAEAESGTVDFGIASSELAIANNTLGSVGAELPDNYVATRIGNSVLYSDGVDEFLITSDGKIITQAEGENLQQFYERLTQELKADNPDNPEIQSMTEEEVFLMNHPEVKEKMVMAAAMVSQYTNSQFKEINYPAMETAANEVLQQAMACNSVEDIAKINPAVACVAAIDKHYNKEITVSQVPEVDEDSIHMTAAKKLVGEMYPPRNNAGAPAPAVTSHSALVDVDPGAAVTPTALPKSIMASKGAAVAA